ncbi:hypothetical protein I7I50_02227 [Histoplasma capsulatum G186AR]|uniref:Uncharacterized protein n=1 Tax=Ajellomyces capsulatus TaxID=5037 RepID=A0A8H7Z5V8_AJECA|nr:hypothetical protein I7I52_01109 [Histoplasma capsulatum]QSS71407.1 hypothetical protein I7I50_02227 [Histoplasma capsulatum G186AR]
MVLALFHAGRVLGARTTLTGLWLAAETDLTSWATGRVCGALKDHPLPHDCCRQDGDETRAPRDIQNKTKSLSVEL